METRKITVVSTKNQKKSVIMSAATTLAELKNDLRANGIDYEGMTFYEGTSKVELINNNSVLPHDVPYKGQTTNELVFMLTNTNKKIRSGAGMTRGRAYDEIKSLGLQEACIRKYGKNFTQCSTADLEALINGTKDRKAPTKKEECGCSTHCEDSVARAAITKLIEVLADNDTLDDDEVEEIASVFGGVIDETHPVSAKIEIPTSSYSNEEIEKMFAFVG